MAAFLLGFPAGLGLAAGNWYRVGKRQRAYAHLAIGIAGMLVLTLLPEGFRGGLLISLAIAAYLYRQTRKVLEEAARDGYTIEGGGAMTGLATVVGGWALMLVPAIAVSMALTIAGVGADAHFYRGYELGQQGRVDEAIAEYSRAIELDPELSEAYFNRGVEYSNQGRLDLAITDYTKVIELDPEDADAYFNRAIAYAGKGNYDATITDSSRAIELDPGHAPAYGVRGWAKAMGGDSAGAGADFDQALSLATNPAEIEYVEELRCLAGLRCE